MKRCVPSIENRKAGFLGLSELRFETGEREKADEWVDGREREQVCEREKETEIESVCVCERERDRERVCVCALIAYVLTKRGGSLSRIYK